MVDEAQGEFSAAPAPDLVSRLRYTANAGIPDFTNSKLLDEAADHIDWLRALIEDACQVFDHYDLPEHAFHYRRELSRKCK